MARLIEIIKPVGWPCIAPRFFLGPAIAFSLLAAGPLPLSASAPNLHTVVVINQASPDSRALANYYCEHRHIPPANVLRIFWPGPNDAWSSIEFDNHLRTPLLEMLAARRLTNQVEFLVLSMDIPYRTILNGTNVNSTTSALFYGLKTDFGTDPTDTNSYALSEAPFSQARPIPAANPSFLTTMLTAGTLTQARHVVDQGIQSDSQFPFAPVVLAKSSDPARNLRHLQFDHAIFESRIGNVINLIRTNSNSPLGATGLLGYQTGLSGYAVSSNAFVPGAIADSMTSFGGIIFGTNDQTSLLGFLHAGASGSYGTVAEPFADLQKFPDPLVYFYQSRGFRLAEAYYQSLRIPYLGLIVADPLAAPFARSGSGKWTGITSNTVLSGVAQLQAKFNAHDAGHPLQRADLFINGTFHQTLTNILPQPGNLLEISLNGYPLRATVPSNATLASLTTLLTALINEPATTNATKIKAWAHGDRIKLQSFGDDQLPYSYYASNFFPVPPVNLQYRVSHLPDSFPPRIQPAGRDFSGQFQLQFEIPTARHYQLEATTNLMLWETIFTNTTPGLVLFQDADSTHYPRRFYRLTGPPVATRPAIFTSGFSPSNTFRLKLESAPGQSAAIQCSPNATDWTGLITNSPGGIFNFEHPVGSAPNQYFYRAQQIISPLPTVTEIAVAPQASLIQISNPAQPYLVEFRTDDTPWTALTTNFAFKAIQTTAQSSPGTGSLLTTFVRTGQPTFLKSIAHGTDEYQVNAFPALSVGAWLSFTITKTNHTVITLATTNTIAGANPATLVAQMVTLINTHSELQGSDGLSAEDFTTNSVFASFQLRARSPGYAAAQIKARAQKYGVNISPSTTRPLFKNQTDLQSRNHLYLTTGLPEFDLNFSLNTTTLPDGHHELTLVAYEGSHVRTQTHATIPLRISNSPLAAILNLGTLTNNASAQGIYPVQVSANTNNVSLITLYSTGGPIGFATNNSNPTFSVVASNLWVGRHPFYALVETATGQKYRTETRWVRLQ